MKRGLQQLVGAVLLIIAIGLPSCVAFNRTLADASPRATISHF